MTIVLHVCHIHNSTCYTLTTAVMPYTIFIELSLYLYFSFFDIAIDWIWILIFYDWLRAWFFLLKKKESNRWNIRMKSKCDECFLTRYTKSHKCFASFKLLTYIWWRGCRCNKLFDYVKIKIISLVPILTHSDIQSDSYVLIIAHSIVLYKLNLIKIENWNCAENAMHTINV